ncbi:MAG: NAD(P)(+) transhydrogenase (Re/Si-specific) subunit beta, partial [Endomicrobium sp.]|nr:NAD(P)(+) transhydrogenase (Re/Si-specific) subunit beta [Endomicrobium sp.]
MQSVISFLNANLATISWYLYLFSAVLFIQGLRFMNSPKTARKGNFVSIIGMLISFVVAFVYAGYTGFASAAVLVALIAGIIAGAVFGFVAAKKVKMTAMPQLVSLF